MTRADVVHHTTPHRGDPVVFYNGPFASSCKPCHDGPEQQAERYGYSLEIGVDGWPIDPRHPTNMPAPTVETDKGRNAIFPYYRLPSES